jgi:hypothetical protein
LDRDVNTDHLDNDVHCVVIRTVERVTVDQARLQSGAQSQTRAATLTLVKRPSAYARYDPAGAYPDNDVFDQLLPLLHKIRAIG